MYTIEINTIMREREGDQSICDWKSERKIMKKNLISIPINNT